MEGKGLTGAAIRFKGIVQGVGFRPLVYRRALLHQLTGSIQNTETGVLIEVDGTRRNIEEFYRDILNNPPILAEIHSSSINFLHYHGFNDFTILRSREEGAGFTPVSPDIATCSECLQEVLNPDDRRYRYPFTNCINCGPRFTIIRSIPYDRKNTSMSEFPMCGECISEYEDPLNRRYHAQPNACPSCGPALRLISADGSPLDGDPIKESIKILETGKILAIKGLGGYHLAVLPLRDEGVERLRQRKKRPGKPFALMVPSIEVARRYCRVGKAEEKLLLNHERPIVLMERNPYCTSLPDIVAPDTKLLGIMLPYTPLHHILLEEGPEILIMTSANLSEEPLSFQDEDARQRLGGIADAFLIHDRVIERPCDDSVVTVLDGLTVHLRRSRGYVPRPVETGNSGGQVFAAGANEKNTFCIMKDGKAFASHHIGDLDNAQSVDAYTRGIHDFLQMFRADPQAVVCDLHPDYVSTAYAEKLAREWDVPLYSVQHHHAHIASVLGEHRVEEKVIGVAWDGTGYGPDGTIWGGEFLVADTTRFTRAGHYSLVPMPGGERCIIEIDRMAAAWLLQAYGSSADIPQFQFIDNFETKLLHIMEKMIGATMNTPLTSSCGRLFDAVAALLGLCSKPAYDAQGAVRLETQAGDMVELTRPYSYHIDAQTVLHFEPMIREIVEDMKRGVSVPAMSQKFHSTVILSGVEMCEKIRKATGINCVAVGGGVFQNRIILKHFITRLEGCGFSVLVNSEFPPNDGGISFGQGMIALNLLEGGSK